MLRLGLLFLTLLAVAGCDGRSDYVGTWRAADADSLDMRYTFFADGTARIIQRGGLAPRTFEAQYEILGDTLLTLEDEVQAGQFAIRLEGDTLRLTNPASGQQTTWVRL
ncbi:hypothetical protein [Rubrivirga sp.]|uniref:hypothetical protein n=1 Tax=Rubrivirga sp. TaxID=1885344 RepID=UPI003C792D00